MKTLTKKIPMPEIAENARLTIQTSGERGRIDSTASVSFFERSSTGYATESFTIYQDFCKRVFPPLMQRVTDKAMEAAHAEALAIVDQIKAAAIAHYKKD